MCAYRLSTSPAITPQLSPATQSGLEEYYKLSKSPQHQQPQLIAASHSYSFSPPTDLSVFALDMDPEEFTGLTNGGDHHGYNEEEQDFASQLAQKEHDLILAAELGKALLEKNEEMIQNSERMAEDFNARIDELTQEKYALKMHLDNVQSECEMTIKDLHTDIKGLKRQLEQQTETNRDGDRTRSQVIHELTKQNERLNEELRSMTKQEESLHDQLESLRHQLYSRNTSHNEEHLSKLHQQEHELSLLSERKSELELQVSHLLEERDLLTCNLDDTQERALMLEKQNRDTLEQMECQRCELQLLKEENEDLKEKLALLSSSQAMYDRRGSQVQESSGTLDASGDSLYTELEMFNTMCTPGRMAQAMSTDSIDDVETHDDEHHYGHNTLHLPSGTNFLSLSCMSDDECDLVNTYTTRSIPQVKGHQDIHRIHNDLHDSHFGDHEIDDVFISSPDEKLKRDLSGVYRTLWRYLSSADVTAAGDTTSMSSDELMTHVRDIATTLALERVTPQQSPDTKESHDRMTHLESKVNDLQHDLSVSQYELGQVKVKLNVKDSELLSKNEEITRLQTKISTQQQNFRSLQNERDNLLDKAAGLSRDETIDKVKRERDQANSKRSSLEVELARSKLDLMSLDNQLMEAIQQKVTLSQELDQWQARLHKLFDVEMHSALSLTDFENLIDLQISTRIQQDKKGAAESRSSKRSSTKSTPAGSPRSSPLVTKRQNKRTDEESKRSNSKHLLPPFL